jgi:alpha-L-rhamnosidase
MSEWSKEDGSLQLDVTIPANTTATVCVPAVSAKQVSSTPALKIGRFEKGAAVYRVGSGRYVFRVVRPTI